MATRYVGVPANAEFPSSNFPAISQTNQRPVLAYDAATVETAYWTDVAPQGLTGPFTAVLTIAMASATTGNTVWQVAIEAISDGDGTPNLSSATSFDTANSSGAVAVPGTAGLIDQFSVTLTTNDSLTAGDYYRISVARDASNVSDTATGDAYLLTVEFRDSA